MSTKIEIFDEGPKNSRTSSVVKIFENIEFGKIRTLVINNEPWFVSKDIAEILGYANTRQAIQVNVDEDDVSIIQMSDLEEGLSDRLPDHMKGSKISIINESGLYSLILRSEKPEAKKFKHWVTSEVLPSIRKMGSYLMEQKKKVLSESESYMRGFDVYLEITRKHIRPSDSSIARMINEAGRVFNYPEIDYVPSKGVVKSATELLKANGVPLSAIAFNKIAMNKGVLVELSRKSSHGYKRFKNIAADWLEFGENQVNPNNPKETQPLWYVDRFPELLKKLEIL